MAKKVTGQIKLQIPAGQANPAPPVGPALGQHGVNIMAFCKEFNAATKEQAGLIIPVVITVFQDKSFTFITKSPPASVLLRRLRRCHGAKTPNKEKVGKVSRKQVMDIVKMKIKDLNATSDEAAFRVIAGTARKQWASISLINLNRGRAIARLHRKKKKKKKKKKRKQQIMPSKRYKKALEAVDATKAYPLKAAVEVLAKFPKAKFNETIDLAFRLGVDAKQSDQMCAWNGAVASREREKTHEGAGICKNGLRPICESGRTEFRRFRRPIKKCNEGWTDFRRGDCHADAMSELRQAR